MAVSDHALTQHVHEPERRHDDEPDRREAEQRRDQRPIRVTRERRHLSRGLGVHRRGDDERGKGAERPQHHADSRKHLAEVVRVRKAHEDLLESPNELGDRTYTRTCRSLRADITPGSARRQYLQRNSASVLTTAS